jgi:hypothetical protein
LNAIRPESSDSTPESDVVNKFWQKGILMAASAILLINAPTADAGSRRWRWNTAPSISGTPSTSVQTGSTYSFTPSAQDAQNDALRFTISNKPVWATFSSSTGRLTGTPGSTQAGSYSNIVIRVSDGRLASSLPAFAITVVAPAAPPAPTNAAPVISGTPSTAVDAGKPYAFTPTASDANGDALGFSIAGKPVWASFNTATGALTGTPSSAQAGSYSNVSISVSDGKVSTSLAPFSIIVRQVVVTGSATLSWTAPTQNTDGTALTNLAGFKIYHGMSTGAMTDVVTVQGAAANGYTFSQLAAGTHYFTVSAYTSSGTESAQSTMGKKTIQ